MPTVPDCCDLKMVAKEIEFRARSRSVASTPVSTAAGSAAQNRWASSNASSNGKCAARLLRKADSANQLLEARVGA
jgi:hypothetical protein